MCSIHPMNAVHSDSVALTCAPGLHAAAVQGRMLCVLVKRHLRADRSTSATPKKCVPHLGCRPSLYLEHLLCLHDSQPVGYAGTPTGMAQTDSCPWFDDIQIAAASQVWHGQTSCPCAGCDYLFWLFYDCGTGRHLPQVCL
jgi:hypothetical protein